MVVHTTMSAGTTEKGVKAFVKKQESQSFRWRSTGWTPLGYPASSLIVNASTYDSISVTESNEVNPFFPLDKDVLRAAMREMLILDGSLNADSLKLNEERTKFRKSSDTQVTEKEPCFGVGPAYASHLEPSTWIPVKVEAAAARGETIVPDNVVKTEPKRKLPTSVFVGKKKQKKRDVSAEKAWKSARAVNDVNLAEKLEEISASVSCAESLVEIMLERAQKQGDPAFLVEPVLCADVQELLSSESQMERPPRKVSDADQSSIADQPLAFMDINEETCGQQDISQFVDIVNRKKDGSVTFLKRTIPSFLDVSIVFESALRNTTFRMICHICESFDVEALRRFLGYKSCALKRERILRILSDYLFDVSHAMFAWRQTESEILSERAGAALPSIASFYQKIDSLVRDSLFDERALKKIGGLDDSSILRHAIEISRSESRKESWERFANTASGRRLLSHHRFGKAYVVGQKRRGQRIKRFCGAASADTSEGGQRSRASSIASYDDFENTVTSITKANLPESNSVASQEQSATPSTIQNLSEVLELTLTREFEKSWGVLLAREDDMCVVDRAPDGSDVRCGDMILSVRNDRGESAAPPASCHATSTISNPTWFQEIVSVFKGSNELHLVVRRVGCLET